MSIHSPNLILSLRDVVAFVSFLLKRDKKSRFTLAFLAVLQKIRQKSKEHLFRS